MGSLQCIVCRRPQASTIVIDGVKVIACEECARGRFTRVRAIEFTLRGRP